MCSHFVYVAIVKHIIVMLSVKVWELLDQCKLRGFDKRKTDMQINLLRSEYLNIAL